ncbi:MAG: hypothetical protein QOF78_3407 [Phycisphaerales bacterium]|nr:hypothetical protein [Phycisphaerales bacterium]
MNLAYVITAHRNPEQLLRLLKAIDRPGNTCVLHIDAHGPSEMHAAARRFAAENRNCRVIASDRIIWGSWRLAHAQIRAIDEALRASREWDYCINLTGQDYPLKTHAQMVAAIAAGPAGANYLEVLDFEQAGANPRKRLEFYWVPWRGKMKKLFRRRPPDFRVYWGSNYFALTRAACEHLATSDLARKMQRAFRFTLCADELIFQNALMHGAAALRESIVNKTWRKLTWAGGSHPKTYTSADLDELLASDAWFARKFDESVDPKILDALDEHLKHPLSQLASERR